jgi:hypothetical protein
MNKGMLQRFKVENQNNIESSNSRGRIDKVFFLTSTEACHRREA